MILEFGCFIKNFVYLLIINIQNMLYYNLINVDAEVLSGTPVFSGTRVPIQSFFWHLEKGISIDEFLDDFPSVTKEQVFKLLQIVEKLFTPNSIKKVYETVA
jgi:uncharacterized protein (DUF433 family)